MLFHSGNQRPVRIPAERAGARHAQRIPPLRVGGFIRTFPFNAATLRASQSQRPDARVIARELHELTGQPAASDERSRREEEEVKENMDGEERFDSLLRGPEDPPLLSQCFRPT